jgi:hypothetical protein
MRRLLAVPLLFSCFVPVLARADAASDKMEEAKKLTMQWLDGKALDAIPVYEDALKAGADEYEVRWREAGAYFWAGEALDPDKDSDKLADLGKKCIDKAEAAAKLKPDLVEGNYYVAACWGEYSHGISIPSALMKGVEPKFRAAAGKAEKIDPTFLNGAPLNAWGRFFYELPWPKRDLDKSEKYLKRNVDATPCNLRTRVYYAETLIKKGGKVDGKDAKDVAKEQLQYVADHDNCADNPDDGTLYKKKAKKILDGMK